MSWREGAVDGSCHPWDGSMGLEEYWLVRRDYLEQSAGEGQTGPETDGAGSGRGRNQHSSEPIAVRRSVDLMSHGRRTAVAKLICAKTMIVSEQKMSLSATEEGRGKAHNLHPTARSRSRSPRGC